MNKQRIAIVCAIILAVAGIGYVLTRPAETTGVAQKQTRKLTEFGAQDKADYIQNLETVSEEWGVLVGKLKEYRPNIPADKRESFDSWVSTFETMIPNFKNKLKEFETMPLTDFLRGREVMNEEFTIVAETYRKIILDFGVNFEEQP